MEEVLILLNEILKPQLRPETQVPFEGWIHDCMNSDQDSRRLLCCLAIDLNSQLVSTDQLVDVFEEMDFGNKKNPKLIFQDALNKENGRLHDFSLVGQSYEGQFCTLIKLETFMHHILNFDHYTSEDEDLVIQRLKAGYYTNLVLKEKRGAPPREVCWVAQNEVIKEVLKYSKAESLNEADELCDRLGLYRDHMGTEFDPLPTYVLLSYPIKMNLQLYQPISLNADWKSTEGLYLSYKNEDTFGRTRPCTSGDFNRSIRERVHHRINQEYSYSASFIGRTSKGHRNTANIINDALIRFNN